MTPLIAVTMRIILERILRLTFIFRQKNINDKLLLQMGLGNMLNQIHLFSKHVPVRIFWKDYATIGGLGEINGRLLLRDWKD